MMDELVRKNRSYRRFYEDERIPREQLVQFCENGHLTPSGGNKQPVLFKIADSREDCEKIFPHVHWAAYFDNWAPKKSERPSAYIFLCTQKGTAAPIDIGITAQTIMLSAVEAGFGGCMMMNLDRKELKDILHLPEDVSIQLCLALGKPKEHVVLEEIPGDGDVKYYRDENGTHHVPKKRLFDVIL